MNAELRFYPSEKSPRGFYIAPNVSYNVIRSGGEEANPFSIGALIGWQWFPGDDFALGMGIGADYYSGSVSEGAGDITQFNGWAPALRFDIGYALGDASQGAVWSRGLPNRSQDTPPSVLSGEGGV